MYLFKTEIGVNGLNGLLAPKHAEATNVQRLRERWEVGLALAHPQPMAASTVQVNPMMLICATSRFPALPPVMNTFMESYLIRFEIKLNHYELLCIIYKLANCFTVNGGWSSWGSYSTCTTSCGNGRQTKIRTCTNPVPAYGGNSCNGSPTYSRTCNIRSCPSKHAILKSFSKKVPINYIFSALLSSCNIYQLFVLRMCDWMEYIILWEWL